MRWSSCIGFLVVLTGCEDGSVTVPESGDLAGVAEMGAPGSGDMAGQPGPDLGPTVPDHPDLTKIVPWKAVDLVGPTLRVWEEYDYRPRAQGGVREDIDATLTHLKAIGVRQVEVQTLYAWSVETARYPGGPNGTQSTVYYRAGYQAQNASTWGTVPRTRRGDMGLTPFLPPASWDQPTMLKDPVALSQKAEAVLGGMLDAVLAHGMIPVLKSEIYLMLADGSDISGDFNYTDPSRNLDQFYAMYKDHLTSMTRLASRHGAAMVILGTETPYVAGAGTVRFADGSLMTDRQATIAGKWRDIIQTVRATAKGEGRPDMVFSYTEINPYWEQRTNQPPPVPIWQRVPFWDDLDVVGINFYEPGRFQDGRGGVDRGAKTTADMVAYGETHNFKTDTVPNLQDIKAFFVGQKGYSLGTKPVIFPEDGCTSSPYGAANPAAPMFLALRQKPDFAEQQHLYEAHFILGEKYGAGWLGGFGFWQVTPTARWGGAWNPGNTTNYSEADSYFNFIGTPTEDTVKAYFTK